MHTDTVKNQFVRRNHFMKIAIISDIHSNLEALTAISLHASKQNVDKFIGLGDYVGYGPDPTPTLNLLSSLPNLITIRGNHDEGVIKGMPNVAARIQAAANWTFEQLSESHIQFLTQLKLMHQEGVATFAHASASSKNIWPYVTQNDLVTDCMNAAGTPFTFIGHVHIPRVFYETPQRQIREFRVPIEQKIPLSLNSRYVINVGSVGQPRDGNNAACYVIYNDNEFHITYHRVAYDYFLTGKKILDAKLDPFFAQRLIIGR